MARHTNPRHAVLLVLVLMAVALWAADPGLRAASDHTGKDVPSKPATATTKADPRLRR